MKIAADGHHGTRHRMIALLTATIAAIGATPLLGACGDPGSGRAGHRSPAPTTPAGQPSSASQPSPSGPSAGTSTSAAPGGAGSQGGVGAGQQPGGRPTAGAPSARMLLTADDLGSGYRVSGREPVLHWGFERNLMWDCQERAKRTLTPQSVRASTFFYSVFDKVGGGEGPVEYVVVYPAGQGRQAAAFYANGFKTCADFRIGSERQRIEVLDTGFAGDGSVLARLTVAFDGGGVHVFLHAFVWAGDVGAEIGFPDVNDVDGARMIARRAAARLAG